ncbi:MAG: hypothetical protein RL174_216 [Actinomycetota bacterium]
MSGEGSGAGSGAGSGVGLKTWGGDARTVASSLEIERVLAKIRLAEECLRSMVTPLAVAGQVADAITGSTKSIAVGLELPVLIEKLRHLELACVEASRAYFQGETELAADIPSLAQTAIDSGFFRETGVEVREVFDSRPAPLERAPDQIAELIWHLQRTDEHTQNRIRIDRLEGSGQFGTDVGSAIGSSIAKGVDPLFLAYVPGTQVWSATAGENPFDATSNVAAMANPNLAATERGLEQALALAGAGAGARVLLVGHSQGGIISANLATRSGFHFFKGPAPETKFKVVGLLTAGAPIGHLRNQMNVPTMSIEHSNDLVPKLDGQLNPNRSNWVTATRALQGANPLQAHELKNYVETAKLVDQAQDSGAKLIREKILNLTKGTTVVETRWFELSRSGERP